MPKLSCLYLLFGGQSFGFRVELFSLGHENYFASFRMLFQGFSVELPTTSLWAHHKFVLIHTHILHILRLLDVLLLDDGLFIVLIYVNWCFHLLFLHFFFFD